MKILVINGTYTQIELALVDNHQIIAKTDFSHIHASTHLLPAIQQLCSQANIKLQDLAALGVNIGPGPFTTMRSIIATINGLAFSTQLVLLPINGIEAFARGYQKEKATDTCILLNAFCNDVYYAQYTYATQLLRSGCISIQGWIEQQQEFIARYPYARIVYAGNGCTIYQHELAKAFGMHAIPVAQGPEVPLLTHIIDATKLAFQQKHSVVQLTPLYFKEYAPRTT